MLTRPTDFLDEKALDPSEGNYLRGIRAAVYGLWSNQIGFADYVQMMVETIDNGLRRAWYQGADDMGIQPEELTPAENQAILNEINSNIGYVYPLGNDIMAADKAHGGKLTPFYRRADMWGGRFEAVRSRARMMAGQDQKLQWQMGPTREHCTDCQRLDGRVYRASIWRSIGLEPRSRLLECRGYKCLCRFVPTTLPSTRGRPPYLGAF